MHTALTKMFNSRRIVSTSYVPGPLGSLHAAATSGRRVGWPYAVIRRTFFLLVSGPFLFFEMKSNRFSQSGDKGSLPGFETPYLWLGAWFFCAGIIHRSQMAMMRSWARGLGSASSSWTCHSRPLFRTANSSPRVILCESSYGHGTSGSSS